MMCRARSELSVPLGMRFDPVQDHVVLEILTEEPPSTSPASIALFSVTRVLLSCAYELG